MQTECNAAYLDFPMVGRREILADFDGGDITSDGGALLLRQVEQITGILRQFADRFTDHRDSELIEHTVEELLAQRVYGLALGDEDLHDHDDLRRDPRLAAVVGELDPTGQSRMRTRDRGKAPAGKSTLNRPELTPTAAGRADRDKKITRRVHDVEDLLVRPSLQAHPRPLEHIVLDLDATDDPNHGHQLGRFFHGYSKGYCDLPLDIFCGDHPLCAKLRPADIDASAGTVKHLQRIVAQLRQAWPELKITLRADSDFCREAIMACTDLIHHARPGGMQAVGPLSGRIVVRGPSCGGADGLRRGLARWVDHAPTSSTEAPDRRPTDRARNRA
ncbi:IS1380 family transposase [Tautonia sp. JC769]|uniref:IS1380 family transposase n=1 Tax=Tautonia sp. JC769 TaxID=3232135 RepID=UPI00345A0E2B